MKILLFLVLLMLASLVSAAEIFHKTKVDMLYPYKDGKIYVGIDTEHDACKNSGKLYRIEVGRAGVTEEAIDKIYAALLAAAAQQNLVEIIFEPSSDGHCYVSRLKVFY